MAGSTSKVLLLGRVGLINQEAAGFKRCRHSREEIALQKEKDHDQIVLLTSEILHDMQIANFERNRCCRPCTLCIRLGLLDSNVRNIQQFDAPAALSEPD